MTTHISDELPRLLTGDATRDEVLSAAEHLRSCPDCQQDLVSAVVAHASLTSAQRFAPEVVARHDSTPTDSVSQTDVTRPDAPLPDLAAMFAEIRAEVAAEPEVPSIDRARHRRRLVAGIAAAAVVAGGGVAAGLTLTASDGPAGRTVALPSTTAGGASATATLVGGNRMHIDATALPALGSGDHYEVWLTNGGRLLPVGFIGNDRKADISVPADVMGSYRDIAVSVQAPHEVRFSGHLVVSGSYA